MKTYKYIMDNYVDDFKIGQNVYVHGTDVQIVTILRVDFVTKTIWFSGVKLKELD